MNYDAPKQLTTYLHRIGRTARAGRDGRAITFVTDYDRAILKQVRRQTTFVTDYGWAILKQVRRQASFVMPYDGAPKS